MRLFFLTVIILLCSSLVQAEIVTVTVKGMVCSFCAQGIKKTFGSKDEVEDVKVDLDSKLVVLNIKKDKTIADDEIKSLINDAGYDVESITRKE